MLRGRAVAKFWVFSRSQERRERREADSQASGERKNGTCKREKVLDKVERRC